MYLSHVEIKNFRGIEKKEIEFKPGFNLIKGVNGKGKTSILEAIAVGLGGYVAGLPEVSTRHFSMDEVRTKYEKSGDGSLNKTYELPIEVSLKAEINGEEYEWTRGKNSIKASRSTIQPRTICKIAENTVVNTKKELPIILYLGAGRVWASKKEKVENVFRNKYTPTVGYTDALIEELNTKLLLNWCMHMEQVSWQKEQKIAEYEAAKSTVARFMDLLEESEEHEVFYDKQEGQMMYRKDNKVLSIEQLSAGYQSVIWIVFDIAYRMAILNPEKKEKIAETKGVVLIDEIDMHLHPKWQWNVIQALRTVFINVQFIAATHSPIMFSSAKDVWLIDIEQDEVSYEYSHYGLDVNTSLSVYQGTEKIPSNVQKRVNAFYNLLSKEKYEEAKVILENLEEETAPSHPLLVELRTAYDLETISWEES